MNLDVLQLAMRGRGHGKKSSSPSGSGLASKISAIPLDQKYWVFVCLHQISYNSARDQASLISSLTVSDPVTSFLVRGTSLAFSSPKRSTSWSLVISMRFATHSISCQLRVGDQRKSFQKM